MCPDSYPDANSQMKKHFSLKNFPSTGGANLGMIKI